MTSAPSPDLAPPPPPARSPFAPGTVRPGVRPFRDALAVSLPYVVFCSAYILASGVIAARLAPSVEALRAIEAAKGTVFVVATGAFLQGVLYLLLRRIAADQERLLAQQRSLAASEGLTLAGIFAASVGHDVNNLMGAVRGNAEFLAESPRLVDPDDRALLRAIDEASGKTVDLVRRMMSLAGKGAPGGEIETDLVPLAREAVAFARVHRSVKGCALRLEFPEGLAGAVNPDLFGRSIMNLVLNAAEATGGRGAILVRLAAREGGFRLEVHDDGPGVPADLRGRILEPLFTTKAEGHGLGLLSFRHLAERCGGRIEVGDSPLGGALFALTAPSAIRPARGAMADPGSGEGRG